MYIIVSFNLRSKAPERIILKGYGRCKNSYVIIIIIIIFGFVDLQHQYLTSTETRTLPFPVMHQFSISSRGAARRGRKWRVVAVTSLPVGFIRLPAASAVALRYRSLPFLNTIFLFRIILINNLTQKMYTVTFKGILTLFRSISVFIQHNIFQDKMFLIC